MMRVSMLVTVSICLVVTASLAEAATQFPYEAIVQIDGVDVRSGPGERYDPTMKLSTGQQVTVHRHDPGGWYMITPPPGSFSWIKAEFVEPAGGSRGIVKAPATSDGLPPRVVVWIGSQFTNEHKYFGRQLASGDEVTILGEETYQSAEGPQRFYKIEPPRQENRWIKGDYVVPLSESDKIARQNPVKPVPFDASETADDPFAGPSFASQPKLSPPGFPVERETKMLERELDRAIETDAVVKSGPDVAELNESRRQLAALDDQLKVMLSQGPAQWRLGEIEQSYRALQTSATPGIASMIDARLETIEARKPIKAEYDAFVAITERTEQRDAELLSLQNANINGVPVSPSAVQLGQPQPMDGPQLPESAVSPQTPPSSVPAEPTSPPIQAPQSTPASPPAAEVNLDQLDGAGIVSRLPIPRPGFPQHVLVAPDGRMLAYLHPENGVNLDAYMGKSVGIVGRRFQDARLRSDVIIVKQLTPVQLQPGRPGATSQRP